MFDKAFKECHAILASVSQEAACLSIPATLVIGRGGGGLWKEQRQHERNAGFRAQQWVLGLIMLPEVRDVMGAFSWLPREQKDKVSSLS